MDRQNNNNNNNNNAADALAVADSIERMLASAESNPFQQEDPQQRARNDAPELIMARQNPTKSLIYYFKGLDDGCFHGWSPRGWLAKMMDKLHEIQARFEQN